MAPLAGLHNRRPHITSKIRSLIKSLIEEPSEYDKIAPNIEYWIEYVLCERFVTVDELVEDISYMAWEQGESFASVGRFLKEFLDAPHRSEQARSFVVKLCEHVLRWFAIAAVEDSYTTVYTIASGGGPGLVRAASFVGYLVEWGLLSHKLVQRHLVKPLTAHHDKSNHRANAICQLFLAAGSTLLRGLLEPEDVQVCFDTLDAGNVAGLNAAKLKEFREIHAAWLMQREGNQSDAKETEISDVEKEKDVMDADFAAEIETPIAFNPQDLPTMETDGGILPSIVQGDEWSSSEAFANISDTAVTSPTLSISTVSDLTPTELGEEIERSDEQTPTRHETFYFEDGNVEILCGDTIFRVHSTVISFSSPKLREMLSPTTLLDAPTPEGCPRVVFEDSAEDFAVMMRVICIPGFPATRGVPEFTTFASLLRMATKYGFSNLRERLVEDLKCAYPTKWEDFEAAKVLGEDIFGSPKPHPNAVLNLFAAQGVKFAIPFASYRASTGGLSALMSDGPGTALPRHTLARTIYGMGLSLRRMASAAYTIAYVRNLGVCPERACVLNVGIDPPEGRKEALRKIYKVLSDERRGGPLGALSLGDLACPKCTDELATYHTAWRRACWERLPATFVDARSWDEV